MSGGFLDDDGRRALQQAITTIEGASAAEVVIAVRRQSARWLHVNFIAGIATAFAALAFMLYSAHPFGLLSILIDPFLAGAIIGALVTLVPPLHRLLTPARYRRAAVRRAACATFHERGVHNTRGRTGMLLYVSIEEQMAELVGDAAVLAKLAPSDWTKACRGVDAAVASGGAAVAKALTALTAPLATALPRSADDVNELPDAIDDGAPGAS